MNDIPGKKYRNPLEQLPLDLHLQIRDEAQQYCKHMPLGFCTVCLVDVLIKHFNTKLNEHEEYCDSIKQKLALESPQKCTSEEPKEPERENGGGAVEGEAEDAN